MPSNVLSTTSRIKRTATPARSAGTADYPASREGEICSPLGRKPQARDRAGLGPPVVFPLRFRDARFEDATSTAARRLDCSDVDLFHLHHRVFFAGFVMSLLHRGGITPALRGAAIAASLGARC
jgi:hypothetical protein